LQSELFGKCPNGNFLPVKINEQLSSHVSTLTGEKSQAEERAVKIERERKIPEDRLRKKEEERQRLKEKLEKEILKSWWKKLFRIK